MVRPMVHSTKHYFQHTIGTVTAGAIESQDFVLAVDVGAKNAPNEIEEGSSIKAFFTELWIRSAATAASSFVFIIVKRGGGQPAPTVTDMVQLQDYNNKKNILYTSQGLTNDVDSTAMALNRGWLKNPKSKQRFGLGDKLSWHLHAIGQSINFCGFETYKEYQ